MNAARRSVQAVILLVVAAALASPVFCQSAQLFRSEARSFDLVSPAPSSTPCAVDRSAALGAVPGDPYRKGRAASCTQAWSKTLAPPPVVPCRLSAQGGMPCSAPADFVRDDLNTMGKPGQAILRARDKVLEILETENACTRWYRTKDSDPAAVFRTLTFSIDHSGDAFVRRVLVAEGVE